MTVNPASPQRDRRLTGAILAAALLSQPACAEYTLGLYAYSHYDYQVARQEFLEAALDNHREAQFYLGEIYEGGVGVPIDYRKAFDWYRRAAQQQHASAQARLGYLYLKGRGVRQDEASAFVWTLRAAENGYPLAQFDVASMYAQGGGTPRDGVEAYKWWSIAASYGDPDAMTARQQIVDSLSQEEIAVAERKARQWEEAWESKLQARDITTRFTVENRQ